VTYRSAYIDSPNKPRYAFGHGLSFTDFRYTDLRIDRTQLLAGEQAVLSFELANTGKVEGTETVQLYIRDMVASVVRPVKELKVFQQVRLRPGERRRVSFTVGAQSLSFFNSQLQWSAEPGDFKLMIGNASDDIRLESTLRLQ
jgi:beta-glucosidase